MKIRNGFVSNSSSASFVVEVKMEEDNYGRYNHDKIFYALYENVETFSTKGCKELLEKSLKFKKKFNKLTEKDEVWKKNRYNSEVEQLEKKIKKLEKYVEPDWYDLDKITDEKKKDLAHYSWKKHKEHVVRDSIQALKWQVSKIDDGYLSFTDHGPICYNGWEDIARRKELLELLSFFTFMKYEVRTRIESHSESF